MGTDRQTSEFLLRACHDLKSPVRGIRVLSELLLKDLTGATPTDLAERLGMIAAGAERIDLLVDGLATYSLALQTEPGRFQSTSMGVVLRAALAKLAKPLAEQGAEVLYDEAMPRVLGDPDGLMLVWEQLLRNVMAHRGPDPPRVRISAAQRAEGGWLFSVRDNGPGVDTEELARIFEPFERLGGSRSAGPGLGLATCRAILEAHGGRIWADAEGGLTIRFVLPEAHPSV